METEKNDMTYNKPNENDFQKIMTISEESSPERDTYFLIWVIRIAVGLKTGRNIPMDLIALILDHKIFANYGIERHLKIYPFYTLTDPPGLRPTERKFRFKRN